MIFEIERIGSVATYSGVDTYYVLTTREPFTLQEAEEALRDTYNLTTSISVLFYPHAFKAIAINHHVS